MLHPRLSGFPGLPLPPPPGLAVFSALTLLGAAGGCRGEEPADTLPVDVEVRVAPTPAAVGPNLVMIEVRDSVGRPVEGASVRVEGTMAHAGMVPVVRDADSSAPGIYRIPDFELTMGGEWILRVHLELPDGRTGMRESRVQVVSAPPASVPRGVP
jgi:hypothetical protein